jgi:uncharacterized protein YciI
MSEAGYPHGDSLVPETFDEHTVLFLRWPANAPTFSEEELDRLQVEHLTYLRGLKRRGLLITNGPLVEQTDERMRGLSIYALPLDEALAVAREDPMVRAGRLEVHGARWMTQSDTARFGAVD